VWQSVRKEGRESRRFEFRLLVGHRGCLRAEEDRYLLALGEHVGEESVPDTILMRRRRSAAPVSRNDARRATDRSRSESPVLPESEDHGVVLGCSRMRCAIGRGNYESSTLGKEDLLRAFDTHDAGPPTDFADGPHHKRGFTLTVVPHQDLD
jgi:hypothetical protein